MQDNGQGVPEELQSRIFREAFLFSNKSADATSQSEFVDRQGGGLGLYVTAYFVQVRREHV